MPVLLALAPRAAPPHLAAPAHSNLLWPRPVAQVRLQQQPDPREHRRRSARSVQPPRRVPMRAAPLRNKVLKAQRSRLSPRSFALPRWGRAAERKQEGPLRRSRAARVERGVAVEDRRARAQSKASGLLQRASLPTNGNQGACRCSLDSRSLYAYT